jgi:hypothetical protein
MGRKALDWPEEKINELHERFLDPTRLMDLEVILEKPADEIVRMIVRCSRRDPVEPGRVWDPNLVEYYVRRNVVLSDLKSAAKEREENALTKLAERREGELENVRGRVRESILVELEQKARDLEAWRKRLDEREKQLDKRERELEKKGESLIKRLRKKENDLGEREALLRRKEEERIERMAREMAEAMSGMPKLGYAIKRIGLGPRDNYLTVKTKYDPHEVKVTVRENFRRHIKGALQILGMEELYKSLIVSVGSNEEVKVLTRKDGRTERLGCFLRAYERMLRREAEGRRV